MSQSIFRALLSLLPRRRRHRYGDEMGDVFRALAADAYARGGTTALLVLLMREVRGLVRFSLRERLSRLADWRPCGGWRPGREWHWAWRGVRARGGRAVSCAALLAIALALTTVAFSSADALLFRRVPYPNATRLMTLGSTPTRLIAEWRTHTDLFDDVHGYMTRPEFLTGQDQPEIVDVADVTPGLIDALGVRPVAGRSLATLDARDASVGAVLLSHRLAVRRFGNAALAVGQRIDTTGAPLVVVGVMPPTFRFPSSGFDVWRAIDLHHPRLRSMVTVGLVREGRSLAEATELVRQRAADAATHAGVTSVKVAARPLLSSTLDDQSRSLLLTVVIAAGCLLLTACLNVASLEMAWALGRLPAIGVQMALGASRATLARVALLEGVAITLIAVAFAAPVATWAAGLLAARLPDRIFDSVNPIDLDGRSVAFLTGISALVWLAIAIPPAVIVLRARAGDLLQSGVRTTPAGTRMRRLLTAGQIAVAVLLLSGTALYGRTYRSLLSIEKGFDATDLHVVTLTLPTQTYPTVASQRRLEREIAERLTARPEVVALTASAPLPPSLGERHRVEAPEIDGRRAAGRDISFGVRRVDTGFFDTLRIPMRAGRPFGTGSAVAEAVIDESMARAFWPDTSPLGRTFRIWADAAPLTVVGVTGHVFNAADDLDAASESFFQVYVPREPSGSEADTTRAFNDLPLYGLVEFAVRLTAGARSDALISTVRAVDSRISVRARAMNAVYAARFADTRLATALIGTFAVVALLLTLAGIYALLSYQVLARRREIGIRLALGARPRAIAQTVIGSALRLALPGAAAGVLVAVAVGRWIESQFFGVAAADPLTHGAVAALIMTTAVIASWWPAAQAARIDPSISLRNP